MRRQECFTLNELIDCSRLGCVYRLMIHYHMLLTKAIYAVSRRMHQTWFLDTVAAAHAWNDDRIGDFLAMGSPFLGCSSCPLQNGRFLTATTWVPINEYLRTPLATILSVLLRNAIDISLYRQGTAAVTSNNSAFCCALCSFTFAMSSRQPFVKSSALGTTGK